VGSATTRPQAISSDGAQPGPGGMLDLLSKIAESPAPLEVDDADSSVTRAETGFIEAPEQDDPAKRELLRRMVRAKIDPHSFEKLCWAADKIDIRALELLADGGVDVRFRDVKGRHVEGSSFEITDDYTSLGSYRLVPEEMTFLGNIVTKKPDGSDDFWPVHLESEHLAHELSHAWDDLMREDTGFRLGRSRVGSERCLSDSAEVKRLFQAHKVAVAADPTRSFSGENVKPGYECESRKEYVAEGLARLLLGDGAALRTKDPGLYAFLKEQYEASVGGTD
jgi:hypothetical protein